MYRTLPRDIIDLLIDRVGLISAADLAGAGAGRRRRTTLLEHQLLVAVTPGVYTAAALPAQLDEWSWFALRSRALVLAAPPDAAAADWSAVALRDLPHLGRPPALPCVIRHATPPRGSDRLACGRVRFASLDPEWVTTVAGVAVVHPAVTAIDIGRRSGRLATLMVADAVARLPDGRESMAAAREAMRHWPGSGRASWAVANADGDCESPLETAGRYALLRSDLPRPQSNVWVGVDQPRYRLDHYWAEQRLALEGDGLHKYQLAGAHGEYDALLVEKDREFELRGWGVTTERYTWRRALFEPAAVAGRCAAVLAAPTRPGHPDLRCWSAAEGYHLRGMEMPHRQLGAGPGWRCRVESALRRLYG